MTQNTTNRLEQYTHMKQIHLKCYHWLQNPVFWEDVLELYQKDIYVASTYPYTEEPRIMSHKSEQK